MYTAYSSLTSSRRSRAVFLTTGCINLLGHIYLYTHVYVHNTFTYTYSLRTPYAPPHFTPAHFARKLAYWVCVCIYLVTRIWVCVYICWVYVYVDVYEDVYVHVHKCMCISALFSTSLNSGPVCMYVCMCVDSYIRT